MWKQSIDKPTVYGHKNTDVLIKTLTLYSKMMMVTMYNGLVTTSVGEMFVIRTTCPPTYITEPH